MTHLLNFAFDDDNLLPFVQATVEGDFDDIIIAEILPNALKSVAEPVVSREGDEKQEIYAAVFGSHLFITYFYRAGRGAMAPRPWIRYCE